MTLNSSGPISLGGSTTGQSIALELGQSATGQISLNDSSVRTLAGVPSGAIVMPLDFWGKSNDTYYINAIYTPPPMFGQTVSDGSVNLYSAINGNINVIKLSSSNSISAQYSITQTFRGSAVVYYNVNGQQYKTVSDSSGNVCFASQVLNSASQIGTTIIKLNSSLSSVVLSNAIGLNYSSSIGNLSLDSSDNMYYGFVQIDSAAYSMGVIKTNSSGVFQWSRYVYTTYGSGIDAQNIDRIYVDSSNNIYFAGSTDDSIIYYNSRALINKVNSSGSLLWQQSLSGGEWGGYSVRVYGLKKDSSGNLYVLLAAYDDYYDYYVYLLKYDTSNNLVWQRGIAEVSGYGYVIGNDFTIDSSGNVYIVGAHNNDDYSNNDTMILKYNSSGSLLWARKFVDINSSAFGASINITNTGAVYVTCNASPSYQLKLSPSGSGTGTYTIAGRSVEYGVLSITDYASSVISVTTSVSLSSEFLFQYASTASLSATSDSLSTVAI